MRDGAELLYLYGRFKYAVYEHASITKWLDKDHDRLMDTLSEAYK